MKIYVTDSALTGDIIHGTGTILSVPEKSRDLILLLAALQEKNPDTEVEFATDTPEGESYKMGEWIGKNLRQLRGERYITCCNLGDVVEPLILIRRL